MLYYCTVNIDEQNLAVMKRDQARKLTLQLNQQMKTYTINKKAGIKHSMDYLRWLISLRKEVELLWSQC